MVEYNEVIKQFKRMCRYTNHSGLPNECPLYCKGHGCNISHCRLLAFEDKKFANVVMAWAAEHPEPVYPTFYDWIESVMGDDRKLIVDDHDFVNWMVTTRIHADIARKLGIEPKDQGSEP